MRNDSGRMRAASFIVLLSVMSAQGALGMSYHDNKVTLPIVSTTALDSEADYGAYYLVNGSYSVDSFRVTNGQDPNHRISTGLVASLGSNGEMSFSVGRKGSHDAANWFNDQVGASHTTFNHNAGELNFAFLGTLKMTITGGILGSGQATFTFEKIGLAQGHAGASNNWWFGGKNCSNIGQERVSCKGASTSGPAAFVFERGHNNVSIVNVTPTTLVDTTEWMGRIDDSHTLDQLVLPGSHDAGLSETHHCFPAGFVDAFARAQGQSIGDQMISGARYFDLRVDYDHDKLVTYHRDGTRGCNGQDLKAVLDQTRDFLAGHQKESVILKFSHIRGDSGHSAASTKQKMNDLFNGYVDRIYTNAQSDPNLASVGLGYVRGKMILVFAYDEHINPSSGRFLYRDGDAVQSGSNLTVYDEYSDTPTLEKMESNQRTKWKDHAGLGKGRFFLLSWTLTSTKGPLTGDIKYLAHKANATLPGVLYDQIKGSTAAKPNVVLIDFVDSTVTQSIVYYNFN